MRKTRLKNNSKNDAPDHEPELIQLGGKAETEGDTEGNTEGDTDMEGDPEAETENGGEPNTQTKGEMQRKSKKYLGKQPGHTDMDVAALMEEIRQAKWRIQELEEKWGAAIEYGEKLEMINNQLTEELERGKGLNSDHV
ncbi:hypothetical protein BS47DRAFT_1357483 [Hydnum rufescens UP504]|uniref:Uncharacterized protein n=1 Tax=Hydnum rufescens UP504 TaxID=1448309 RepID=A0A9P6E070_9AGAM|nr:hypothetical protein BS47DRAFT_1357483 [Hydnum rufescens UP504]